MENLIINDIHVAKDYPSKSARNKQTKNYFQSLKFPYGWHLGEMFVSMLPSQILSYKYRPCNKYNHYFDQHEDYF